MLAWLKNLVAPSRKVRLPGRALGVLRARYDAAVTSDDNRRHWAAAEARLSNSKTNTFNTPDWGHTSFCEKAARPVLRPG